MADKRMFSKTIIDSDAFLEMQQSAQLLYFHLSMRADDDGFINKPKTIMRMVGCKDDDLRVLVSRKFIIPFDTGVVVIKHWKIHNYIAKDRYRETNYKDEMAMLRLDENKAYTLEKNDSYTDCIQVVDEMETQVRLGKDSIGKDSIDKKKRNKYGAYAHVLLSDEDVEKLRTELGDLTTDRCISFLDEYIEMKGSKYKSHYLVIKKWVIDAVKEKERKGGYRDEPARPVAEPVADLTRDEEEELLRQFGYDPNNI